MVRVIQVIQKTVVQVILLRFVLLVATYVLVVRVIQVIRRTVVRVIIVTYVLQVIHIIVVQVLLIR